MYPLSYLAELFSSYFSETIMTIRNELCSQTVLRYMPKYILSLMLPYPPSTASIKQFSFTDCSTIWVSLVMSLIDFLHIFLVEFKLALFTRLHLFQHYVSSRLRQGSVLGHIFFRLIHSPSFFHSLLSLTIIRSSIIQTPTIPNSRTLILQLAFLASLTLRGYTPIIIIKECKTDNKVYLNDKTEIMIISTSRMSTSLSTQEYFATSNVPVPLYDTFNHIVVTLDCHLYFQSNMSSTMSVQLTLHVVVCVPFVIS